MKAIFTTLAIWLTLAVFSHGSSSMTENAFLAQFRKAIESKDIKSIEALTYQEGMSEKDKAIAKRAIEMLISNASEIEAVFLSPLPNDCSTCGSH